MIDFPSMPWVKLPFVDIIHSQSNKSATNVENKASGDLKLYDSPDCCLVRLPALMFSKRTYVIIIIYVNVN